MLAELKEIREALEAAYQRGMAVGMLKERRPYVMSSETLLDIDNRIIAFGNEQQVNLDTLIAKREAQRVRKDDGSKKEAVKYAIMETSRWLHDSTRWWEEDDAKPSLGEKLSANIAAIYAPSDQQPQPAPDAEWPECSGDPLSCPENEGYGCCTFRERAIKLARDKHSALLRDCISFAPDTIIAPDREQVAKEFIAAIVTTAFGAIERQSATPPAPTADEAGQVTVEDSLLTSAITAYNEQKSASSSECSMTGMMAAISVVNRDELTAALIEKLGQALRAADEHVKELSDAWERGAISEHDGLGGTRSNRNVEVELLVRQALAALEAHKQAAALKTDPCPAA